MENLYVIVDTKSDRFYQGETEYIPWIVYAFTFDLRDAVWYDNKEQATSDIAQFEETKTEFDGNTPLEKRRLVVKQITLTPVE